MPGLNVNAVPAGLRLVDDLRVRHVLARAAAHGELERAAHAVGAAVAVGVHQHHAQRRVAVICGNARRVRQ